MKSTSGKSPESILYVEDDLAFGTTFSAFLKTHFSSIKTASTLEEAKLLLKKRTFEIVLLDKWVPGGSTFSLVPDLIARGSTVIFITSDMDFSSGLDSLEMGAHEYIIKPISKLNPAHVETQKFFNEALFRIFKAKGNLSLLKKNEILAKQLEKVSSSQIIGRSTFAETIREGILKLGSAKNILITGEAGSGKKLVANVIQTIHGEGRNRATLNCAATLEPYFNQALFGSESEGTINTGYPTDLIAKSKDGYLLINDIELLPLDTQEKLFDALSTGYYLRVGGCHRLRCQITLIVTSRTNLHALAQIGKFNKDLLQLLSLNHLLINPLRTRKEDILDIAIQYLIRTYGVRYSISDAFKQHIKTLSFPGNVKELQLLIDAAILKANRKSETTLKLEHLTLTASTIFEKASPTSKRQVTPETYSDLMRHVERQYLTACLALFEGNKNDLYGPLGLSRTTLYSKLKVLGVEK